MASKYCVVAGLQCLYKVNMPCPLTAMSFNGSNHSNNIGGGSAKKHVGQIIVKLGPYFCTIFLLKVLLYKENKPCTLIAMFVKFVSNYFQINLGNNFVKLTKRSNCLFNIHLHLHLKRYQLLRWICNTWLLPQCFQLYSIINNKTLIYKDFQLFCLNVLQICCMLERLTKFQSLIHTLSTC